LKRGRERRRVRIKKKMISQSSGKPEMMSLASQKNKKRKKRLAPSQTFSS
jgi:hypothetical protein